MMKLAINGSGVWQRLLPPPPKKKADAYVR